MKNKHLTQDERYQIMHGLNRGDSFKAIAKSIGRDCSTISKEVRGRVVFKQSGCLGNKFNECTLRFGCLENALCGTTCKNKLCRRCSKIQCFKICKSFKKEICDKKSTPPYVCNSCDRLKKKCTLEKTLYSALSAHREYKSVLIDTRSGVCAEPDEIARLDAIVSPLVKKGQSIHHVCANHADEIMHSERTIYTYIGKGLLSANNFDLARKVRFRPRKSRHDDFKVDKGCRNGRSYEDYKAFIAANPDTRVVQMDTVYGRKGDGKCLLTIHFTDSHFMLVYLLGARTAKSVANVFRSLRSVLGNKLFAALFTVILTDNGSEFSDPRAIECDEEGELLSRVYYCDPRMSQQKGAIENNHILLRYILPKGTSFEDLTQVDVSLIMNHINSYGRKALNDCSPHFVFECVFGVGALKKIGAELVPPDNITLRPSLLKR